MELNDDMVKWIETHRNDDVTKLRLRYHKSSDIDIAFAILQIECRRKVLRKIPKTLSNPRFIFPTALSAEQCTSDLLAEFHASLINDGENILDMTCGLGIDTFHFARKAKNVTAIELDADVANAATINARTLSLDNITIINDNCINFITTDNNIYDTIFIDPARRGEGGKRLYALTDCIPDVTAIIDVIKAKCNRLIIKASPMIDISKTLEEHPYISEVYTLGTKQECKELILIADFSKKTITPILHAVTMTESGISELRYTAIEEHKSIPLFDTPNENNYIYEPFPALMKAAPYRLLSAKYNVNKLHPNTHIYTSNKYIENFPGDIFRIDKIIEFSSKEIKNIYKSYPQINVATRNFILTADELRKRLKVKDGGENKLMGVTLANNRRILLILSPIKIQ